MEQQPLSSAQMFGGTIGHPILLDPRERRVRVE
jgi:hypothetical protein